MTDKNKTVTKPKRKPVPFEWTSDSIEKISIVPPTAPVKLANTDLESIISRVTERKKENAARVAKLALKSKNTKLVIR